MARRRINKTKKFRNAVKNPRTLHYDIRVESSHRINSECSDHRSANDERNIMVGYSTRSHGLKTNSS